jgi:hypothetical protein
MLQNIKAQTHYGAGCRGRNCQDSRNSSRIVKSRIIKAWEGIRICLIKKSRFDIFSGIITVENTRTRLGEVSVVLCLHKVKGVVAESFAALVKECLMDAERGCDDSEDEEGWLLMRIHPRSVPPPDERRDLSALSCET